MLHGDSREEQRLVDMECRPKEVSRAVKHTSDKQYEVEASDVLSEQRNAASRSYVRGQHTTAGAEPTWIVAEL